MQGEKLIERIRQGKASRDSIQSRIVTYVSDNPSRVFTKKDLRDRFPEVKETTMNGVVWQVTRNGLIGKVKVGGTTYYGVQDIIARVKETEEAESRSQTGRKLSEEGKIV